MGKSSSKQKADITTPTKDKKVKRKKSKKETANGDTGIEEVGMHDKKDDAELPMNVQAAEKDTKAPDDFSKKETDSTGSGNAPTEIVEDSPNKETQKVAQLSEVQSPSEPSVSPVEAKTPESNEKTETQTVPEPPKEVKAENEPKVETEEVQKTSEPEVKSEPVVEAHQSPVPVSEPLAVPEVQSTAETKPEPVEKKLEVEVKTETEPVAENKSEVESKVETEQPVVPPEPVVESKPEPVTEVSAEPTVKQEPAEVVAKLVEKQEVVEVAAEPIANQEPVIENAQPVAEAVPSETKPDSVSEVAVESPVEKSELVVVETVPEPVATSEPIHEPKKVEETQPEPIPEPVNEVKDEPSPAAETAPEVVSEPVQEVQPEPILAPEPVKESEPEIVPAPEPIKECEPVPEKVGDAEPVANEEAKLPVPEPESVLQQEQNCENSVSPATEEVPDQNSVNAVKTEAEISPQSPVESSPVMESDRLNGHTEPQVNGVESDTQNGTSNEEGEAIINGDVKENGPSEAATLISWKHGGQEVAVCGDFCNWGDNCSLIENDGVFSTKIKLAKGQHHIKFFVDGKWTVDENAPVVELEGHGQVNLLVVPAGSD